MTVAAKVPSIGYVEDGVSLDFPAPFRYLDATCLDVTRFHVDGTSQDLALGPDFTATPGPTDAGGTVTLLATIAGARLKIVRATPRVQPIDYQTNDRFPAETHELGLDRDMLIEQEQDAGFSDLAERALQVPPGETVADLPPADERAQAILGFDADGNPIVFPAAELGSVAVVAQHIEITASAGQTTFQMIETYTVGYVGVYVNGVRLSEQEFTATDGSHVVLDEPCLAGDIVLLEGFIGAAVPGDSRLDTYQRASLGSAGQVRSVAHKLDDRFDLRDMAGLDLTGANSMTTLVQQAINQAIVDKASLHIPIGIITLDNTITITDSLSIVGENCGTGKAMAGYSAVDVTTASRFHLAHNGKGFALDGQGVSFDWVLFRDIMTSRVQPTPTTVVGSFTPGNQDYDFDVYNAAGLQLQNVCMLNPAQGINLRGGGNIGRLWTDNLMGQPLRVGVNVELNADVFRMHNTHWWPFWHDQIEVNRWTLGNCDGLYLKRCDTPLLSNYFSIAQRSGIRISSNASGGVTKLKGVNIDLDYGAKGIWFDSAANNCWAWLSNVSIQGAAATSLANTPGLAVRENITMEGTSGVGFLYISGLDLAGASGSAIKLNTANQRLEVSSGFWLHDYGGSPEGSADASAAILVSSASSAFIANVAIANYLPGHGPLVAGSGRIEGIKVAYSPTARAQAGTLTTIATTGSFIKQGNRVIGEADITFTNIGTATGWVRITMPTAVDSTFIGSAVNVSQGTPVLAIGAVGAPGEIQFQYSPAANIAVAGHTISVSFAYVLTTAGN